MDYQAQMDVTNTIMIIVTMATTFLPIIIIALVFRAIKNSVTTNIVQKTGLNKEKFKQLLQSGGLPAFLKELQQMKGTTVNYYKKDSSNMPAQGQPTPFQNQSLPSTYSPSNLNISPTGKPGQKIESILNPHAKEDSKNQIVRLGFALIAAVVLGILISQYLLPSL